VGSIFFVFCRTDASTPFILQFFFFGGFLPR